MPTIIFKVLETPSHLNATFKLAYFLKKRHYNVVYIGVSKTQEIITQQGFEYYNHYHFTPSTFKSGNIINNFRYKYQANQQYRSFFLNGNLFEDVIKKFSPSLFIIDISFNFMFPILEHKNLRFIFLCSKVSLNRSPLVPPFTSSYLPKNRSVDYILIRILWNIYFLNRGIQLLKKTIKFFGSSSLNLMKDYLKKFDSKLIKEIDTNRVTHFGLRSVPEIILSLEEFDFPRIIAENQFYMSPTLNFNEKNLTDNCNFFDSNRIVQEKKFDKIVYCSFGSYDSKFRKKRMTFILKLINLFLPKKNYCLIISTGNDVSPSSYSYSAENIFLFQKVPQLEILSHINLMINHGGMQSIEECIMTETPMLIYPLNPNLDQNGNAARVLYYGLGLRGVMNEDSDKEVFQKIEKLLYEPLFKINIRSFKEKCTQNNSFEKGINFIEYFMNKEL